MKCSTDQQFEEHKEIEQDGMENVLSRSSLNMFNKIFSTLDVSSSSLRFYLKCLKIQLLHWQSSMFHFFILYSSIKSPKKFSNKTRFVENVAKTQEKCPREWIDDWRFHSRWRWSRCAQHWSPAQNHQEMLEEEHADMYSPPEGDKVMFWWNNRWFSRVILVTEKPQPKLY